MLLRISFLIFFLFSLIYADFVKIYSPYTKEVNNKIFIKKPFLIYKDFFIEADEAIIENNKKAIFRGNVIVFYKDEVLKSDKVILLSKNNIILFNSFFYDSKTDVWFKNKRAKIKNQNIINFKNTIFSSCCVKNPDWYLFVKNGSYNKKTKYIKFYNLTLFIHNTPIFYFPFYFNSLDKTRRSGLLRPYIGFSAKEGFLYSQPIYFVTSIRSDLEITPTIRTKRGRGIYFTYRFVDSPFSYGEFKTGEFIDYNKFYIKNQLAYKKHFGYQFEYKRDKIFKNDKLYMLIRYANDVDYFYLNPYNYTFNTSYLTDKIITSKINYIKFFNNSLLGIYNRYYIDTSLLSNKNTIQTIPQINYHIFEKKHSFLLASFDYNYYNYFNENHKRYFVNTFNFPVGVNFSFFENYLKLKISEIIEGELGNYYNSKYEPSYNINTYTQFKLFSSLTHRGNFLHIINPSISYNIKNYSKQKITSDVINKTSLKNNISLDLFQIFEKNSFYFDHTFHQLLYINQHKQELMENILNLNYNIFSLNENNKFDWNLKRSIYNAVTFKISKNNNLISLSHIYQYEPVSKSIDVRLEKGLNPYKKLYFEYNYDMIQKYAKFIIFGIKLNKKCWQYNINFRKNINPVLKDSGISYNTNYIFTLNVNFYPIGGVKQSILFK